MSLTEHLRSGQQCDEEGVMCIVSRQACHEAADKIQGLEEDLNSALNVAYNHGASEWVIANYPDFKPIRSGGVRSNI